MSIADWFAKVVSPGGAGGSRQGGSGASADTETVKRIVRELDKLDPGQARYLASFAYVLSRVASADLKITEAETARMVSLLREKGGLSDAQALLVVEIAKTQNKLFGGTENFLVTREFRAIASEDQRRDLLHCLFAIACADEAISGDEEAQIWQIASELGFEHAEYIKIRLVYSKKRTVFQSGHTS